MSETTYAPHIPIIEPIDTNVFYETFGLGSRLNLINSLNIKKLAILIQNFDPKTNKETNRATAYLGIPEALLLANDILSGRYAKITKDIPADGESEPVFTSYGGSSSDNKIVCRLFVINKRKGKWSLKITEGPGKKTATGGFTFDGKTDKTVYIGMNDDGLKQMALMIQNECLAYRTAQLVQLIK